MMIWSAPTASSRFAQFRPLSSKQAGWQWSARKRSISPASQLDREALFSVAFSTTRERREDGASGKEENDGAKGLTSTATVRPAKRPVLSALDYALPHTNTHTLTNLSQCPANAAVWTILLPGEKCMKYVAGRERRRDAHAASKPCLSRARAGRQTRARLSSKELHQTNRHCPLRFTGSMSGKREGGFREKRQS